MFVGIKNKYVFAHIVNYQLSQSGHSEPSDDTAGSQCQDPKPAFTLKQGFTAAHPTWNFRLFKTLFLNTRITKTWHKALGGKRNNEASCFYLKML